MKKILQASLLAAMLLGLFSCNSYAQKSPAKKEKSPETKDREDWLYSRQRGEPGTWKAYVEKDGIYFIIIHI